MVLLIAENIREAVILIVHFPSLYSCRRSIGISLSLSLHSLVCCTSNFKGLRVPRQFLACSGGVCVH